MSLSEPTISSRYSTKLTGCRSIYVASGENYIDANLLKPVEARYAKLIFAGDSVSVGDIEVYGHRKGAHISSLKGQKKERIYLEISELSCTFATRKYKKMKRPQIVQAIRSTLQKVAPTAEVILYGSEARGDAQENSDIDLLILVEKEEITNQDIVNIAYPLYELEEVFNYQVNISPLVYTRNQWYGRPFRTPFYINVMNEGVRLQ